MKKSWMAAPVDALVMLSACSKNDDEAPVNYIDPEMSVTVESIVTTQTTTEDVVEEAEYEVDLYTGSESAFATLPSASSIAPDLKSTETSDRYKFRYRWQKCPLITIESNNGKYPITITLNYGESTELENGRVLSGIVRIVLSASPRVDGATRTVTFDSFNVDGINIEGTSIKTFHGDRIQERQVTIERDLQFTYEDGTEINCTAEKTRNWVAGINTPLDPTDDVIEISGYSNCEDSDGNTFKAEITKNLVKKGDCRYIVGGEITFSVNEAIFASIDYGDNDCDRVATLTTASGSIKIQIGKRIWVYRHLPK